MSRAAVSISWPWTITSSPTTSIRESSFSVVTRTVWLAAALAAGADSAGAAARGAIVSRAEAGSGTIARSAATAAATAGARAGTGRPRREFPGGGRRGGERAHGDDQMADPARPGQAAALFEGHEPTCWIQRLERVAAAEDFRDDGAN